MDSSDVGQWVTLIGVVVGFIWQGYREARNRRWDREDRAESARLLASKVNADAKAIEERVTREAKQVAQLAIEAAQKIEQNLMGGIKETTDISTKAFHEANSVNVKLQELGLEHNQLQREKQAQERDHEA